MKNMDKMTESNQSNNPQMGQGGAMGNQFQTNSMPGFGNPMMN
ncbi:MAG: hypothetical protein ACMG6E_10135 [Candidatus Roizmanbacteria bacterium]